MSNTINVNYMTRTYSDFLKNYEAKNSPKSASTFGDKVAEKHEEITAASGTQSAGTVSTKDMTMEEYKQYIHDKISQMTMNPSRMRDTISINISEAGFEAMKNDPEYEEWVLDYLQKDFNCYNPWASSCGGCYCVKYIGATKEEYRGESWYAGYQNGSGKSLFDSKAKNNFWERRVEQKKRTEAQIKEQQKKKQTQKEEFEKAAMEKSNAHKRLMSQWEKEAVYSDLILAKSASAGIISTANAAYKANFLMADNGFI